MEKEKNYKVTHNFYIAGVRFHDLHLVEDELAEGNELELIPDPTNKFDPNAVEIWYDNRIDSKVLLGFVPRKFSSEVSAALEIGKDLQCILVKFNKSAKPWEQAKVEIREELS